ncbi:MAG: cupin domain-containing protein [Henriciella sp.]|nr:cupin domain-containing protein [Henriciella sp.]
MATERVYLSKRDISNLAGEDKTHFLNPNARRLQKSLGDLVGITGFGFHIIEVQPGFETTELHFHHFEDECLYVLSGTATAYVGDHAFQISEGDFLGHRKQGAPHALKNTGEDVFKCIVVGERLTSDVVDYPKLNKRLFRNTGLPSHLTDIDDEGE